MKNKDKANDNVTFICKRFYFVAILKELGISRNENTKFTKIYKRYDFVDQEIINKHFKVYKKQRSCCT